MSGIGLGESFDISVGFTAVDMTTAANTGKRVNMTGVENCTIVLCKGVGTAAQDPALTVSQHTAASAGTTTVLAANLTYYTKTGAPLLLGSELWVAGNIPASANGLLTLTGNAVNEMIVAINVPGEALAAGNGWISLSIPDVGANSQVGCLLYLLRSDDRRAAPSMPAPLR